MPEAYCVRGIEISLLPFTILLSSNTPLMVYISTLSMLTLELTICISELLFTIVGYTLKLL